MTLKEYLGIDVIRSFSPSIVNWGLEIGELVN